MIELLSALRAKIGQPAFTIVLIVASAVALLAISALTESIAEWRADSRISAYVKQADDALKEAEAARERSVTAQQEAKQYKDQLATWQSRVNELEQQLEVLQNEQSRLAENSRSAAQRVEAVRNKKAKPVDSSIGNRVRDLSSSIDELYPNNDDD